MKGKEGPPAGKISKPYGIRGEVQAVLFPDVTKFIKSGTPLFVDLDGQRVPFFIEEVELVPLNQAILKLEFIDSVEGAKNLSGREIYMDPVAWPGHDKEKDDPGKLIGYQVRDQKLGKLGRITGYRPGTMNPMWFIEIAGKEIMVPAAREFIVETDHGGRVVLLDLPEGITEL
jgi:16S rRNA processing protein RimM